MEGRRGRLDLLSEVCRTGRGFGGPTVNTPATDDELRAIFRRILAHDPDFLRELDEAGGGNQTVILMSAFLISTVRRLTGESVDAERAVRIVREVFASMKEEAAHA